MIPFPVRCPLRRFAAALLCLSLPLFTGCGDDSNDDSSPAPTLTATLVPATQTPTSPSTATNTRTSTPTISPTNTSIPAPTSSPTASPTQPPTGTPTATATPSTGVTNTPSATPTGMIAHGSVEQVYVINAGAGTGLQLQNAAGNVLQRVSADSQGSYVFVSVPPGTGYVVTAGTDSTAQTSPPLTVTAPDDNPPASFYEQQHIGGGYGYLETRDGTKLAINVKLPGSIARGPYPTVIEYSGYDPANPSSTQPASLLAAGLGYAVVGVNMRGTGCSGGAFHYFETLQNTDGYDVIETIAMQPWVKGHKVGMVGVSYPGISQLFVAQTQPPHLAAITPLSIIADTFRGTVYPGGILNNGFAVDWAEGRQSDARPYGQGWEQKRANAGDQTCIDNQKLHTQAQDLLTLIYSNKFYYASQDDPLAPVTFVNRITVPVFLAGAWQDEQTGGFFPTMLDQFTGTDKLHFTMVNGDHIDSVDPTIFSRWMEFLSFYVADEIPRASSAATAILLAVGQGAFNVKGIKPDPDRFTDAPSLEAARARFEADPHVRILFESGAGENGAAAGGPVAGFEQSFDRWPIPTLQPTIWYFGEGGKLLSTPPTGDGSDSYAYDDASSQQTSFTGGESDLWRALPQWTWEPLEEGRAVAYRTDPLPETVVLAGSASVDLWLQSTATDTDLQVTISEIRPDGQEVYVQSGWLRASHRKLDPDRSTLLRPVQTQLEGDAAPLPAGQFVEARVEMFPFAHAFRAGSSIRISVEPPGGDRPLWKFAALPRNATNTIGRSATYPSRVVLPVVPGVEVTTPLPPACALRGQPCRQYVEIANTPG